MPCINSVERPRKKCQRWAMNGVWWESRCHMIKRGILCRTAPIGGYNTIWLLQPRGTSWMIVFWGPESWLEAPVLKVRARLQRTFQAPVQGVNVGGWAADWKVRSWNGSIEISEFFIGTSGEETFCNRDDDGDDDNQLCRLLVYAIKRKFHMPHMIPAWQWQSLHFLFKLLPMFHNTNSIYFCFRVSNFKTVLVQVRTHSEPVQKGSEICGTSDWNRWSGLGQHPNPNPKIRSGSVQFGFGLKFGTGLCHH